MSVKATVAQATGRVALKAGKKGGELGLKGAKNLLVQTPKVGVGVAAAGGATYGLVEAEKYEKLLPVGTRNLSSAGIAALVTAGTGVAAWKIGYRGAKGYAAALLAGGAVAGARNVTDRIPGVEGFPFVPDSALPSRR